MCGEFTALAAWSKGVKASFIRVSRNWIQLTADAGLILSLLVAFYVGFRMPSLWSINYYIPSFFDGFYRRSLMGSVLQPVGALRFDYYFIAALQASVLLALLYLLIVHALRSDLRVKLLAMAFLLGPTGGYLFHEIGYIEQLLYLILLSCMAIKDKRLSLALLVASLFIHEMAAFTIIPIYLARFVERRQYGSATVQSVILLMVFAMIYFYFQIPSLAAVDDLIREIKKHAGYTLRLDYYEVFQQQFLGERARNYYNRFSIVQLSVAVVVAGLVAATVLRKGKFVSSLLASVCILVACLLPLMMGFFGWDVHRWVFLSLCSSFVVLMLSEEPLPPSIATGVTILLLLLVVSRLQYFDGYRPRPLFPYPPLLDFFSRELPSRITTLPVL